MFYPKQSPVLLGDVWDIFRPSYWATIAGKFESGVTGSGAPTVNPSGAPVVVQNTAPSASAQSSQTMKYVGIAAVAVVAAMVVMKK